MRRCRECKEDKEASEYYKDKTKPKGTTICKTCAKWYEYVKRVADVRKDLVLKAKRRAEIKDVPFNILYTDISLPSHCSILGIPLKVNKGKAGYDSYSLDRIIPKLGYVKGNVRIISNRANTIKSDATSEELFKVAWDLKQLEEQTLSKELL